MKLIAWSLGHVRVVLALYALVMLLTLVSLACWIPTRLNPSLESPLLAVISQRSNQTPAQVESSITNPLERDLAGLPGLVQMRSMSMHELSLIVLEFPYGSKLASLKNTVAAQLPAGSRLVSYDPLDLPVLSLAVRFPGQEDSLWLRDLLEREVAGTFSKVQGVDRVALFGVRPQLEVFPRSESGGVPLGRPDQISLDPARVAKLEQALQGVHSLEQIRQLEVDGRPLSELALLKVGPGHDSPRYRYNGQEAFEINIFQTPRASSSLLVGELRRVATRLQTRYPGLVCEEAYNNAHFVEVMQSNVWLELLLAVALTGGVVWLFLREVRGTLIALATVPSALALTLLGFVPLGLSLNSSSLIGLLLALGRLVDDTVIDLHAVSDHLSQGKSVPQAALDGCSEVRPAVVSATLVLALAMLPLTWCGGLTQDMFEGIVWPFLISLAASLFVSLTLTPVLIRLLYRGGSRPAPGYRFYSRLLRAALARPAFCLGVAAALSYLAFLLLPFIGSEMMPASDTGQLYVEMESQPNSSSQETFQLAASLEQVLRRLPEVQKVSCEVGMEPRVTSLSGYDMGAAHKARMLVTLVDAGQRRRTLWQVADQAYANALREVPGIRRLMLKEMGSDVMASSMAPVELVLSGPNLKRLAWLGEQTRALGRQIRGLHMLGTSWTLGRAPRVLFRPPPGPGRRLGETSDGVPIVLQDRQPYEEDVAVIEHVDRQRCISVMATTRPGGPGSMRLGMALQMASQSQLPYPAAYKALQRGDMRAMMDSFDRLLKGMALGAGLIYLSLFLWFRDARLPLLLLVAVPLELAGVVLALLLAHQIFSSVSLLGLVVLHGMDVMASILLLDRVERLRRGGLGAHEALLEGAPARLRPILMTVLITLAVMTPLALFPRTGMDAYSPLATVVLGGLSVSALLTLLVLPALYLLLFEGDLVTSERTPGEPNSEGNDNVRCGPGELGQSP